MPPFLDEDTQPNVTLRPEDQTESQRGRLLGILSLIGAFVFTIATVVILLSGDEATPPAPVTVDEPTAVPAQPTATPANTTILTEPQNAGVQPTLDGNTADTLLNAPLTERDGVSSAARISRDGIDPFTVIPDRPRNEIIQYTAQRGDTVNAIADRYGLQPETLAWSNDRRIVQAIFPGDVLNIPPVDGVLVTAVGSTRTIADYAALYEVDDPFVVLDSPYNADALVGLSVDSVPPAGTQIFIPGGVAEEVVWQSDIRVSSSGGDGGSGSAATVSTVTFENNQPGSCAPQEITGGTRWDLPVAPGTYTITQGFSPVVHPGIDLAGSTGAPIRAANGGRVIFAGRNNFGYGNLVVLIHGPFMTVYGHLDTWNVSCGQDVVTGAIIGTMGSTGRSSGPHLHFEIRVRSGDTYVPQNPAATLGF